MAIDVYISEEKIQARIQEMANQISKDYANCELIVVAVLNGSFIFCADLVRKLKLASVQVEFIGASSYGEGTTSSGNVKIYLDLKRDIKDKHVLVVEDIVDTGHTLNSLLSILQSRGPKNLKLASLLFKPARLIHKVPIDYLGFEIDDKFVIGYGLDFAGNYRQLPYIGIYNEQSN